MRASTERRLVLMGDQSLLAQCGETALRRGHRIAAVVTASEAVARWAREAALPVIDAGADIAAAVADEAFDWFLSIANLRIVPRAVWGRAREGAANFHDGPLPHYAGLNTPAWAILNGETSHGITWHAMTDAVDAGGVYVARRFEIGPDETSFSLNGRCFEAGMESFAELLDGIEAGTLAPRPQEQGPLTLYRQTARPEAAGLLLFDRPAEALARLARALDFGPGYANPLLLPKLWLNGRAYPVGSVTATGALTVSPPGTVLAADADGLTVAALDGAVRVEGLRQEDGTAIMADTLAAAGDALPLLAADALAAIARASEAATRNEAWGEARLAALAPLSLPEIRPEGTGETRLVSVPVALPSSLSGERTVSMLAAYLVRVSGEARFDLAYADADTGAAGRAHPGLFSPALPLRVEGEGLTGAALERTLADAIAALRAHAPQPADLPLRRPGLAAPRYGVALAAAEAPGPQHAVAGCPLTLVAGSGEALIVHDGARLPTAEAQALAERLATFAAAFAAEPDRRIQDLPLISQALRERMLFDWNRTETPYEAACLHALIERQVDRSPDATALVAGTESLSYRALDERANRVAHALRARGVGPDQPVGLYAARGLDLVVGALAIQKAGGAYVPLDPAYPRERLALMIEDSGLSVVLTQRALAGAVPGAPETILAIEEACAGSGPATRPESGATPAHAAYVIYTSGSTGRPKGVVVEHRNVANFFAGMDERVARDAPGEPHAQPTWLAVTSLSFDISVLELFWTLARGFKVIVAAAPTGAAAGPAAVPMEFSLFHWGQAERGGEMYRLLLESARFADAHGFTAVWTPERHFHDFGAPYPNPAVTGAAVAAVTSRVAIRAGSCVLPLHHPARVAEEWAVVDHLSGGRAGIAFASGWMPEDFLLRPENAPPRNKDALLRDLDTVRRLWRGEAVPFDGPGGTIDVVTQPRPVSRELPVWITTAGNPDSFREAGRLGANLLTHLLGQTVEELGEKIAIYRTALAEAGHDPAAHTVTLMLHTLLGEDREAVRALAREPMRDYLRSAAALVKQYAWAFPAFKRPAGVTQPMALDLRTLAPEEMDAILDFAFERYFENSGLFGTRADALARAAQVKAVGVDEIACLIDFGLPTATVLESLHPLAAVVADCNRGAAEATEEPDGLGALIRRHWVSHLQCTPSMARMLLGSPEDRAGLDGLRHLHVGGEAVSGDLVAELRAAGVATITNMYGPTETTIWSSTQEALPGAGTVPLGRPIANTRLYVLDGRMRPLPPLLPGELYIGGDGVARGYLNRPELTAERFLADPFAEGGRLYRTGDLVQFEPDGTLRFLGRIDGQVKLRGHRIELGEIETALRAESGVGEAVAIMREDRPGDQRLVAYIVPDGSAPPAETLRAALARTLPEIMVPAHVVTLERLPLTPNAKIDRKALPPPPVEAAAALAAETVEAAEPADGLEAAIAAVFGRVLGLERVAGEASFFALGGHSLLAMQAHRELKAGVAPRLGITDLFRFPSARALARHLADAGAADAALASVSSRAAQRRNALRGRGGALRETRDAG
ncbi:D-alanine--D-alanyl carrier protein ligase [Methylorubrum aminovorans]|uniref:D-alanine--D-alanyl carrier protein ligase n=1 Tax=Methylorubrum aminovorans TaxID=269069 RepID=A0ABQ4UA45_9HYPH|nr:MupA/Atu3671 family FMN-dependent luciferase-like monooxygenase [Methylorubrum aminovorans]GJE64119.1 D-alanine--D-alanyl carrier protein ligase [Methylorubrum aminovorans]